MHNSFIALSILVPTILLQGCGVLVTDGKAEIRHRYYAVYADDMMDVLVVDESYLWDCSGTMARCYDRESNYGVAIYRIDPADTTATANRDTLVNTPGSRGFRGGYDVPVLYFSSKQDRMLYELIDSSDIYHLMLTDAHGKNAFDLHSLGPLSDRYRVAVMPDPSFSRIAFLSNNLGSGLIVYLINPATRSITDTIPIALSESDTTATFGRGLIWESVSSLVVYGKGNRSDHGEVAYRIKNGKVTDTIPNWGCLTMHPTAGGPYSNFLQKLRMTDMGLKLDPVESWRCLL